MSEFKKVLDVYQNHKDLITNESQTKQYLIMPILKILGYDLTNPREVVSEFTADVAGKKGEKLDFVVKIDNKIEILIECKHYTNKLSRKDREQLERYFQCREEVENARIAIFTNGVVWNFYSNSITDSQLDVEPFYIFNLEKPETHDKVFLFSKEKFDFDTIFNDAKNRNRVLSMKRFFEKLFEYNKDTPIEEIYKIIDILPKFDIDTGSQRRENKAKEYYTPFLMARDEFIQEYVTNKLKSKDNDIAEINNNKEDITPQEYEVYRIVLSIVSEYINTERIILRNSSGVGNSSIIFDDNQRKPILYIRFAGAEKFITFGKYPEKIFITNTSEIYKYKDKINEITKSYNE